MDHGAQSVMMQQVQWMLKLCADNWAMMFNVRHPSLQFIISLKLQHLLLDKCN